MSTEVRKLFLLIAIALTPICLFAFVDAQIPAATPEISQRYLDRVGGITADDAVATAMANNDELQALRKEVEAARSLVKQAGLRANPTLDAGGAKQVGGMDNNQMAEVILPLELGGRRPARIAVATGELEVREFALQNQVRLLASEIRLKFGEALAAIKKLELIEQDLTAANQGFELVSARVTEGKVAPLDQSIFQVEINRLRSLRETAEGKVESVLFELRNLMGMRPEDQLRLRGGFDDLIAPLPSLSQSTNMALQTRPDLGGTRAMERLALARIEKAKSEGRIDAAVKTGYQRMNSGFPLSGIDERGMLRPIQEVFHFFTFGVEIDLPVRNRNQGAIEAATFDLQAARDRTSFGEITIRREVSSAFVRYDRAARALTIFRNGVRDQASSNLNIIRQTYELGSRSLLDYLGEQRRFLEIENELVDAEFETYGAKIEVLRVSNSPELK